MFHQAKKEEKKNCEESDTCYCDTPERNKQVWGGISATKVYMVTSEKMSGSIKNTPSFRWDDLRILYKTHSLRQ